MQLGKLRQDIGAIRATGAEVLAISNDGLADARRMASELGSAIRVLSDPSMRAVYGYGMKGENMPMAAMGYVVIDRAGIVRARAIDRAFGARGGEIAELLRRHATARSAG